MVSKALTKAMPRARRSANVHDSAVLIADDVDTLGSRGIESFTLCWKFVWGLTLQLI
jgi:hypothetical protein